MSKKNHKQIFKRKDLIEIAYKTKSCGSSAEFGEYLKAEVLPRIPFNAYHGSWFQVFTKLIKFCETGKPFSNVMSLKGNKKLPFANFSTLPLVMCPGKGSCEKFCYSLKAWRSPAAYGRQVQNTLLMLYDKKTIAKYFLALKQNIEFRLYVDGDFNNLHDLHFWSNLLKMRPDINTYGYSKSWVLFLEFYNAGNTWPDNYLMNVSSGSKYDDTLKDKILELPFVRDEFVAVKTSKKYHGFKRYKDKAYHADVLASARKQFPDRKVVSCPGSCGDCGKGKHWCGQASLKGVIIAIGVH